MWGDVHRHDDPMIDVAIRPPHNHDVGVTACEYNQKEKTKLDEIGWFAQNVMKGTANVRFCTNLKECTLQADVPGELIQVSRLRRPPEALQPSILDFLQ